MTTEKKKLMASNRRLSQRQLPPESRHFCLSSSPDFWPQENHVIVSHRLNANRDERERELAALGQV